MGEPELRDVSLVAVTSHEMRAPLAAIRGFVDMLQRRREELTDEEVAEFLQVISVQTDRLIRLTDDLVTMESLGHAGLTIEHEPIVLVPSLEQLIRELPGGDRIELRVSADAPPAIESDALRFGQVLVNLLSNALKFSDDSDVVTVEVMARGEDRIGFNVIDHGIGIGADDRARVFEPFFRTAEGARSAEGSGLGLAITVRLVDALGGDIVAESTPGGGSTFRVTLPIHAAGR
ncbi:MAG: HAMP domain-containing histidine kinase [Actinomycetota bacterium]|nr:HAMP domain-containing histidine kinase [Actinomycetota bacterium]MDH5224159.1 HAMP domain-containing histidine kinase [Actinomycetota bacterium]MDH5312257.1 HAMP domain-containing histidine kinase [Actinomycetota bacterium]